jgi:UDP-3-O-[3-hydroxymyristoyl] glucosamine N-acyltransferase
MKFSAEQIASLIEGKIEGDGNITVGSFSKIEDAKTNDLAFLANPKYENFLYTTGAGIIIIANDLEIKEPIKSTIIRVKDPYSSFAFLMKYHQEMAGKQQVGIETHSLVHPTAKIGEHVYIGAFAYIGENAVIGEGSKIFPHTFIGQDVTIGEKSILHAGVKIYHGCVIGNNVVIHAGTVVGSDGFGFAPQQDGSYQKVPQLGNVVVEDAVEIGANTCIDRATMGSTIIRRGTKLDNLLQVAHNVEIGEDCVIAAQTGISGSTRIGRRVMIGGQVGVIGHITVAEGTKVGAQSGITKTVKEKNTSLNGTPAHDHLSSIRAQAVLRRLPELEKKIIELEKTISLLSKEKDTIS